MKVAVTGGAGFVGSNLVPLLLEQGHEVRILDNFSKGRRSYIDHLDVEILEGDILDTGFCESALENIDSVVHLAAAGSVVESIETPQVNFDINVLGTFNVLNAIVKNSVKRIVFASTGGAIMGNTPPPVNETTLPAPISPYGASKLCGEAYCRAFHNSYGIQSTALRFANVYGQNSKHKSGVFNKFYEALTNNKPLTIYGDGSSTRDYIFVSDLCRGIVLALHYDSKDFELFHIASGRETSLSTLANLFIDYFDGDTSDINYLPARIGEVEHNFASFDKAQAVLGFNPEMTLESGIQATLDWFRAT